MLPRYSSTRRTSNLPIACFKNASHPGPAANDNGYLETSDRLLHAALRHFSEHGLGAAREARDQAERAFFAGDRQSYDWWLAVCRTLDRRMATQLDYEFDQMPVPAR